MIILQLDKDKLEKILNSKHLTANQLSQDLVVRRRPTESTLTKWENGGFVAERWRKEICRVVHAQENELFDSTGCFRKSAFESSRVTREFLAKISAPETITRASITNWKSGGGIEPDNLFALAHYLEVEPVKLLSEQTCSLLSAVMGISAPTGLIALLSLSLIFLLTQVPLILDMIPDGIT